MFVWNGFDLLEGILPSETGLKGFVVPLTLSGFGASFDTLESGLRDRNLDRRGGFSSSPFSLTKSESLSIDDDVSASFSLTRPRALASE